MQINVHGKWRIHVILTVPVSIFYAVYTSVTRLLTYKNLYQQSIIIFRIS